MYDTTNIKLQKDNVPSLKSVDLLEYVPQFLSNVKLIGSDGCLVSVVGNLGSLKVIVSEHSVKISNQSLPKWHRGNSIEPMNINDNKQMFERLSDELHLPMFEADVTKLHVKFDFKMKYKPQSYFSELGLLNHFERSMIKGSLYYNQTNGVMNFYDSLKAHKKEVSSLMGIDNLLRYERRFDKRLCSQFNMAEIKVKHLVNKQFCNIVLDRFITDYQAINKIRKLNIDFGMIRTPTQLANQGILKLIEEQGGLLNALESVKQAQRLGQLTKSQAQDLRNRYNAVAKHQLMTVESDLVRELDSKVLEVKGLFF